MRVLRLFTVVGAVVAIGACASSGGSSSSTPSSTAPKTTTSSRSGGGLLNSVPEMTPALIDSGKAIYNKRPCAQCHGLGGVGSVNAPNLADKNWLRGGGDYNMIVTVIINGVGQQDVVGGYGRGMPARGMPIDESAAMRMGASAVRMTDAEVRAVAAYVCSLSDCTKK